MRELQARHGVALPQHTRPPSSSRRAGVIKGHVLMGPHPGQSTTALVKNMDGLLRAGVTTFASLQHEMPGLLVTGTAHTDAGTMSARSRRSYGQRNVHTARNYMGEAQHMLDTGSFPNSGQGLHLSFVHLPISEGDGATGSDAAVKDFTLQLLKYVKAGEVLYLQCGDGNGRSGTIAALLLGLVYGLSSSEAIDAAQRYRSDRAGAGGNAPETHEQKMQVHRLLKDSAFRQAAISAVAGEAPSQEETVSADLQGVYLKLRKALQRLGYNALLLLRNFVGANTAGEAWVGSLQAVMDKLVGFHPSLYLTPAEAALLGSTSASPPGTIHTGELIKGIRGRMPPGRSEAVHAAFNKMDVGGTGFIEWNDIAMLFAPRGHPDVVGGKRTEEAVRADFLNTFGHGETFGDLPTAAGAAAKRSVHVTSFEDYWAHVSASIEDDATFKMMMWNVWPVRGKGTHADPIGRQSPARTTTGPAGTAATEHGYTFTAVGSLDDLCKELCAAAAKASDMAVSGLLQALAGQALPGTSAVDEAGFQAAVREVGVAPSAMSDTRLHFLFSQALTEQGGGGGGALDVAAFHKRLRGRLPEGRRRLVLAAFERLTQIAGGSAGVQGAVPAQVIVGEFNAAKHPAVQAGRKTPEEVMRAFVRAFGNGAADGLVRLPYFEGFYEGVSAACGDDDALFKVVLWNTMKLDAPIGSRAARQHEYAAEAINARAWDGHAGFLSQLERLGTPQAEAVHRPSKVLHSHRVSGSDAVSQSLVMAGGHGTAAGVGLGSPHGTRGGTGVGAAVAAGVGRPANKPKTHVFSPPPKTAGGAGGYSATPQHIGAPTAVTGERAPALFSPVRPPPPAQPTPGGFQYAPTTGRGVPTTHHQLGQTVDPQATAARQQAAAGGVGTTGGTAHYAAAGNIGAAPTSNLVGIAPGSAAAGQDRAADPLHFGRDRGRRNFHASPASGVAQHSKTYASNVPWDTRDGHYTSGDAVASLRSTALSAHGVTQAGGIISELSPSKPAAHSAPTSVSHGGQPAALESARGEIRRILLSRGVRSTFGLQRQFWNADASGSGFLPPHAFEQVLLQFGVGVTEAQARALSAEHEQEPGKVDYTAFLYGVLGQLSPTRAAWVGKVYAALHSAAMKARAQGAAVGSEVSGAPIPIDYLRMHFASAEHPEVRSGTRPEAEVLREFLETFTFHPRHAASAPPTDPTDVFTSGGVTAGDWQHYYALVSASIPEDTHFQVILWSVWRMADIVSSPVSKPAGTPASPAARGRLQRNVAEGQGQGWGVEQLGFADTESGRLMAAHSKAHGSAQVSLAVPDVLARIQAAMRRRGRSTIVALAAALRSADRSAHAGVRLGRLTRSAVRQVMSDMSMGVSDTELDVLFGAFDAAGHGAASGEMAYEHFLDAMAGPMSQAREQLVLDAWNKVPGSEAGAVHLASLRKVVSAATDKDVCAGRKTENRVKGELLQPLVDAAGGGTGTGGDVVISVDHFLRVHAHLSACIEDDAAFHLHMWNAWLNGR